jgi:hypothetical protein
MMRGTTAERERRFQLPCGCTITESEGEPSIEWCPHHEMLHGVIPMKRTETRSQTSIQNDRAAPDLR